MRINLSTTTTQSKNPAIIMEVGNSVVELSITQARQLGLKILSTAELSSIEHQIKDFLDFRVGDEEARLIMAQVNNAIEDKE